MSDYLDFFVTSSKCGSEKPNKQIFNCALDLVAQHTKKDFSNLQPLHIGDNLEEDYHGAIKAGFSALLLDPQNKYSQLVNPEHCIEDLNNVIKVLEKNT